MLGLAVAAAELVQRLLRAGAGLCGISRGAGTRDAVHCHTGVCTTVTGSDCAGEGGYRMNRNTWIDGCRGCSSAGVAGAGIESIGTLRSAGMRGVVHSHVCVYITGA